MNKSLTHSVDAPIPVTLLTGFLGSGKTTLLNRLLRQPALTHTLVVINEFGAVALDHHLVVHDRHQEQVVELRGGCLCCTVRGDLISTLRNARWRFSQQGRRQFQRVVIETTGLADPAPILHTFVTDPQLKQHYRIDGVVTALDAVNGVSTLDAHAEAIKQLAVADAVVLTKCDLVDDRVLARLQTRLSEINPGALRLDAAAPFDPRCLLGLGFEPAAKSADVLRWLAAEAAHGHGHGHDHEHDHDHDHEHHHDDHPVHEVNRHSDAVAAFCVRVNAPLQRESVLRWLADLVACHGERLLRVKGILNFAEDPRPTVIHGVQHVWHPPTHLRDWPDADRSSRLVFITRDLPRTTLEESLRHCVGGDYTVEEKAA